MLPSNTEYLFAVILLLCLGLSAFWDHIVSAIREKVAWQAIAVFLAYCGLIEGLGLTLGWWRFNPERLLGLAILGVPLEEALLFVTFFLLTLGVWKAAKSYASN